MNRYHVQVYVREGGDRYAWRRVHPTGGDPYVFTREEAQEYIRSQSGAYGHDPKNWRIENAEVPTHDAFHNYDCDGDKCQNPIGQVRVYPLGAGGNLILCFHCWANENRHNYERGWEQRNWFAAKVYGGDE